MNTLLKLEYAALFGLSIFLFALLPYAWWWYPVLLLTPDIGMLGYPLVALAGAIMLGHSALDRMLGYGLKYSDSFKHTHLGQL